MSDRMCSVEGCPGRQIAKGLCSMHYERQRRTGTIEPKAKIPKPKARCNSEGCTEDAFAKGLCTMHYQRARKGIPLDLPRDFNIGVLHHSWREEIGYSGVHRRLTAIRGKASEFMCRDCEDLAAQWSYNYTGVRERSENGMAYSLDLRSYSPRCSKCHSRLDEFFRTYS